MSVKPETNDYGYRGVTVTPSVPDAYESDQVRIGANITDPDGSASITLLGPRGAIKGGVRLSADDLAELATALTAIVAELQAARRS